MLQFLLSLVRFCKQALTVLCQLLYAAGFLFMGATEEQMNLIANSPMDGVSYILILYSFAFLVFLFVHMLLALYERTQATDGKVALNGNAPGEARQLRDAEEFELEGLMSDDEDETKRSARRGPDSPDSTLGGNSDRMAR